MPGQLSLIVGALALIGGGMWWLSSSRTADQRQEARQDELEAFTSEISELIGEVETPIREMLGAPFNTANAEAIDALRAQTKSWTAQLEETGALAQNLAPPEGADIAAQVVQQGLLAYRSAAVTYELVPGEDDDARQQRLIELATQQRDQAGRILNAGLIALNAERREAGMGETEIPPPGSLTPILPTPEPAASEKPNKNKKKNDG
jgi:hypothetical protein